MVEVKTASAQMTRGVVDLIRMTETVREIVVQNKKRARFQERYSHMEQFMKEEAALDAALILIKTLDRKNQYASASTSKTLSIDTNGNTSQAPNPAPETRP